MSEAPAVVVAEFRGQVELVVTLQVPLGQFAEHVAVRHWAWARGANETNSESNTKNISACHAAVLILFADW